MTKRKFERHFAGKDNAGLRAKIRSAVSGLRCGNANAANIRSLAKTVVLTAKGKSTLEAVAADYKAVHGDHKYTCDCTACYAVNEPEAREVRRVRA